MLQKEKQSKSVQCPFHCPSAQLAKLYLLIDTGFCVFKRAGYNATRTNWVSNTMGSGERSPPAVEDTFGPAKTLVLGRAYGVLMLRQGSHPWEPLRVPGPGSASPSPIIGALITQLRVPSCHDNTMASLWGLVGVRMAKWSKAPYSSSASPWGLFPYDSPILTLVKI